MKIKAETNTADVGILVARFQVAQLHQVHIDLIETVSQAHDRLVIFLGLSPIKGSVYNPLDYESRRRMIQEDFPDVTVVYIPDMANDTAWSKKLDKEIERLIKPSQTVMLYGGRDSFLEQYNGKFPSTEFEQEVWVSGTELRKKVSNSTKSTKEFREGAIWATSLRHPSVLATVDVAIWNEEGTKLLLARKPDEKKYRFVGGFANPNSASYEADARREVTEETHLDITDPEYLASTYIEDWRLRNEQDKIKTILFEAKKFAGRPQADDDIAEVRWFDWNELSKRDLVTTHHVLYDLLAAKTRIGERKLP